MTLRLTADKSSISTNMDAGVVKIVELIYQSVEIPIKPPITIRIAGLNSDIALFLEETKEVVPINLGYEEIKWEIVRELTYDEGVYFISSGNYEDQLWDILSVALEY